VLVSVLAFILIGLFSDRFSRRQSALAAVVSVTLASVQLLFARFL
jgi:MFS family permease